MKMDLIERKQLIPILVIIFLVVLIAFTAGFFTARYTSFLGTNQFKVLLEAHTVLEKYALEALPSPQELEYGMIHGMLQKVDDPYTVFVAPAQHELQTDQLQGKFGGIGARLERDAQGYVLLYPFPDSPALKAGIGDGDRLISVENLLVVPDTTFEKIQAAIRGPIGKNVELVVGKKPDFTALTVRIRREEVQLPSVTWNILQDYNNIGIVHINIIAATTPQEVENAILVLKAEGANRFIIDLRNNTGGLLQAGVDTAGLFLEKGVIIQQQYKEKEVDDLETKVDGKFIDLPIVILVNHGSASAAEIIAGAIQSQNRGAIVGSKTYGKDSIQLVFDLSDGSSMHVTSAKWWVPDLNYPIGVNGIIPDLEVPDEQTYQAEIIRLAADYLQENE